MSTQHEQPHRAVILTAIPVEYNAVRAYLSNLREARHPEGTLYEIGDFNYDSRAWEVLIAQIGVGNMVAAVETERAIRYFNPAVALFVGVAGGVKDVALGDVVAVTKVYGYESGKADLEFKSRPFADRLTYMMEQRARAEQRKGNWRRRVTPPTANPSSVHLGPIAAGEKVIASTRSSIYQFLSETYNDTLAVEMEGRGFVEALHANPGVAALIIRGISDLIDDKPTADATGSQEIASRHAGAFAFEILANLEPVDVREPTLFEVPEAPHAIYKAGNAPPRPTLIIGRTDALWDLKARLGIKPGLSESSPMQILTAVKGWPGVGKTTLAATLANEPDIYTAFPDGVLWASLGQTPNLLSEMAAWGRALGTDEMLRTPTLKEAAAQLRALLRNRRMLLIVDDVWETEHAAPFQQARGERCALLLTTRLPKVSAEMAVPGAVYNLEVLAEADAMELLRALTPTVVAQYPNDCLQLARELEYLPLALQVAGHLLHVEAGMGWGVDDLLKALREGAQTILDKNAPPDRMDMASQTIPTVAVLLQKSADRLDAATLECFAYLGAFAPKPATFDLAAMKAVWQVEDAKPIVRTLVERGLLEPVPETGRFQMHALLVAHAKSLLTED